MLNSKFCKVIALFMAALLCVPAGPSSRALAVESHDTCLAPQSRIDEALLAAAVKDIQENLHLGPKKLKPKFLRLLKLMGWERVFPTLLDTVVLYGHRYNAMIALTEILRGKGKSSVALYKILHQMDGRLDRVGLATRDLIVADWGTQPASQINWFDPHDPERVAREHIFEDENLREWIRPYEFLTRKCGYQCWWKIQLAQKKHSSWILEPFFKRALPKLQRSFGKDLAYYWPGIAELCTLAPPYHLCARSIPALHRAFGNKLKRYWKDIVEMARAQGESAPEFLTDGLIPMVDFFGKDLPYYWPGLKRLAIKCGPGTVNLFRKGIPTMRKILGKRFKRLWPTLVILGAVAGSRAAPLICGALPALSHLAQRPDDLIPLGYDLLRWVRSIYVPAELVLENAIPACKGWIKTRESLVVFLSDLETLYQRHSRGDPGRIIKFGLPNVAGLIGSRNDFKTLWGELLLFYTTITLDRIHTAAPSVFDNYLTAIAPLIKTRDDFVDRQQELLNTILPAVEGAEEETAKALAKLRPFLRHMPEAWLDLVLPTIQSQKTESPVVLKALAKLHRRGMIRSGADLKFLKYIITQKGVRAWDILEYFLLAAANAKILRRPLSDEQPYLKEFIDSGVFCDPQIYGDFRTKAALQGWTSPRRKRELEKLLARQKKMRKSIVAGEIPTQFRTRFASSRNERNMIVFNGIVKNIPAVELLLMDVFPPAMTVNRRDYRRLFEQAKDHPEHVPVVLNKIQKKWIEVPMGAYVLKEGASMDTKGLEPLLKLMRGAAEERGPTPSLKVMGESLLRHLAKNAFADDQIRSAEFRKLYRYFRRARGAGLPGNPTNHAGLALYQEFLGDTLPELVRSSLLAFQKASPQAYRSLAISASPDNAGAIEGMAKNVHQILVRYRQGKMAKAVVQTAVTTILSRQGLDGRQLWHDLLRLRDTQSLEKYLSSRAPPQADTVEILVSRINNNLVQKERMAFAAEAAKWEFRAGRRIKKLRAVITKRKAHAVCGFNSGVCTAQDQQLWENPDFLNVILFDENDVAQGGMQLLIGPPGLKGHVVLVGNNPGYHLLNEVDPKALYQEMIHLAQDIAQLLGLDKRVLIPLDPYLHSNRPIFKEIIKSKTYPLTGNFPTAIRFSYDPASEIRAVYVVPPRPEILGAPGASSEDKMVAASL